MTERDTVTGRPKPDASGAELPPPSIGGEAVTGAPTIIGSSDPSTISVSENGPPVSGGASASAGNGRVRIGDRVFQALTTGAGAFVVVLVLLVAVFLIYEAVPAIKDDHVNFLTSREWDTTTGTLRFGIAGLLWTTVLISVVAMVIAVPISIGIALFITQYAPKRLAKPVAYTIDLLAAIPSIIYGIWGITEFGPKLEHVQKALFNLDFIPLFADKGFDSGNSAFIGGVVLSIMILPIITAISRDVFERTPRANIEAALALGATRWEMIRMAVLPYGRAGVVSGAMLGLGRALGETIAILLIVSSTSNGAAFSTSIFDGGQTFASKIAADTAEFGSQPGPYIAAGLVLFVLTFLVNGAARSIVNRKKDFS